MKRTLAQASLLNPAKNFFLPIVLVSTFGCQSNVPVDVTDSTLDTVQVIKLKKPYTPSRTSGFIQAIEDSPQSVSNKTQVVTFVTLKDDSKYQIKILAISDEQKKFVIGKFAVYISRLPDCELTSTGQKFVRIFEDAFEVKY